jgi:hypothetical protein
MKYSPHDIDHSKTKMIAYSDKSQSHGDGSTSPLLNKTRRWPLRRFLQGLSTRMKSNRSDAKVHLSANSRVDLPAKSNQHYPTKRNSITGKKRQFGNSYQSIDDGDGSILNKCTCSEPSQHAGGSDDDSSHKTALPEHLRGILESNVVMSPASRKNILAMDPFLATTKFIQPILDSFVEGNTDSKNVPHCCRCGNKIKRFDQTISSSLEKGEKKDHSNEIHDSTDDVKNAFDEVVASLILNASDLLSMNHDNDISGEHDETSQNLDMDDWVEEVFDQLDEIDESLFPRRFWRKRTMSKPIFV